MTDLLADPVDPPAGWQRDHLDRYVNLTAEARVRVQVLDEGP